MLKKFYINHFKAYIIKSDSIRFHIIRLNSFQKYFLNLIGKNLIELIYFKTFQND